MAKRDTETGGRAASGGVIPGRWALSVGHPKTPAPAGFAWRQLTDLARLESGHTPSRRHPEYWNGTIPWIGIKDATQNHGRRITDTNERVTQLGIDHSSARVLPAGTVCLSRTASVGYTVMMAVPMSTSQDFVNWVCGPELNADYLMYVLMLEQDSIRRFAHGTTHQTMYYPEAKALHICVPSRNEQDRLVAVLRALDDLIDVNRKLAGDLVALALTRYQEYAAQARGTVALGSVASVNAAQTKAQATGTLTYLDIASVGDGDVDWPEAMPWTEAPSRARRLAPAGTTIWSTVRPDRRAHALLTHTPANLVVSTGFATISPKTIGAAEIFCATDSAAFVDYLMSRAEGSAYPAVRPAVFEQAPIADLGTALSKSFEEEAWPLLEAAGELRRETAQLAATRNELLAPLLSGQAVLTGLAS